MIPEEVARTERLHSLRNKGINAYPEQVERTHSVEQVLLHFDDLNTNKTSVSVAGRIRFIRKHGGLTFIGLQDASGSIQVALKRDDIGIDAYEAFHGHADVGDFFSFTGPVFITKKGEKSVNGLEYKIASKALLPLPEKWHGLTDTETRYRHRSLDLLANPSVMEAAKTRSRMIAALRRYLDQEGFMEVETPILQPIAGGATARPFVTHHNTLHADLYLRIAPELYLKRLLVGGFEKIYEFARCFRNEGVSPQHNPEFTQIELYWTYATVEDLMDHLEGMLAYVITEVNGNLELTYQGHELNFGTPLKRVKFRDLIETGTGINLDEVITEEELREQMQKQGINAEGVIGYGELVDKLYKEKVRPSIIQPTFVTEYPSAMKPLAKRRENALYSASAQLLIAGMEVWNAFNELNDPIEQEERFKEQEELRERGSDDAHQVDDAFLKALKHGMPPTAGYGLGIDRFASVLADVPNLKEIILFPTLKPVPVQGGEEDSEVSEA